MTGNSSGITTSGPITGRISVVCPDCDRLGRASAQTALAVKDGRGWSLFDTSHRTWLAETRRIVGDSEAELEDRQAAEGYAVTDSRPASRVVFSPGALGANPTHLHFGCRNGDCNRATPPDGVRTNRFMKRVDKASRAGETKVRF